MNRYDYISPGLEVRKLDHAFPHMIEGDPTNHPWPHLRRRVPHKWYVDARSPHIGFLSRDEAMLLYNTALRFKGEDALEIGCWVGWSSAHLALAGVNLDIIDPALKQPEILCTVRKSFKALGLEAALYLNSSPDGVTKLGRHRRSRRWSFAFIDGDHDNGAPLRDVQAVMPFMAEDAAIMFHDLVAPDVLQAVTYLYLLGWGIKKYSTMQGMAVAFRGNFTPVEHFPDTLCLADTP